MAHYIVGLTGGIASGKTTVAKQLVHLGIDEVDADIVARQVVAKGSNGLSQLVQAFGEQMLTAEGELNRPKLREYVFNHPPAKATLNAILHPLIRQALLQQLEQSSTPYTLLTAPLLFENNLQQYCDFTVLVDVAPNLQLSRGAARDGCEQVLIQQIIDAQMPREDKQQLAHCIIENNQGLNELTAKVARLHQQLLAQASAKN